MPPDIPPALCLTFDDLFVESWLAARPVFDAAGARVTFCVCHIHQATDRQIAGLRTLQADGHEIAFHSRTHPRLGPYLRRHGLAHWLEHEIDAGIAEHRALGFPAESFASPFHAATPQTRAATAGRFAITRAGGPRGAKPGDLAARIYRRPGPDRTVDCIGFCDLSHRAFPGWDWQMNLLDRIAETGGAGVFAGHDIRPPGGGSHFYSTPADLGRFLAAAAGRGLRFLTLRELAPPQHLTRSISGS